MEFDGSDRYVSFDSLGYSPEENRGRWSGSISDYTTMAGKKTIGEISKVKKFEKISGVGSRKTIQLCEAGYESIGDLQRSSHSEIAEVDGIGNALAARIKADVGDIEDEDSDDGYVGFAMGSGEATDKMKVNSVGLGSDSMIVDVDADELVEELESAGPDENDEVNFLEKETLMYGME